MWREVVAAAYPVHVFRDGADAEASTLAKARLGVDIPADLQSLLVESNGVEGEYGLGLVWPIERIVTDNLAFRSRPDFRTLYMPFEPLLFFGDAGNGDQFAFVILDGQVRRPDVFVWNHEDDSRQWAAANLRTYLERWSDGRLTV